MKTSRAELRSVSIYEAGMLRTCYRWCRRRRWCDQEDGGCTQDTKNGNQAKDRAEALTVYRWIPFAMHRQIDRRERQTDTQKIPVVGYRFQTIEIREAECERASEQACIIIIYAKKPDRVEAARVRFFLEKCDAMWDPILASLRLHSLSTDLFFFALLIRGFSHAGSSL